MASNTKQTDAIRRRKAARNARNKRKARAAAGTPPFPIHPEQAPSKMAKPASEAKT